MGRQTFGTRKDDITSDLDLMFCTDSRVVSNIMRLASEPRAYTTIRTFLQVATTRRQRASRRKAASSP
jgi:hypothetical protein